MKLFRNLSKFEICSWILLTILLVFCFFSFQQSDLAATASHGYQMLSLTLKGNFFSFYDVCNYAGARVPAVYYFPIYLVFAIWSLPVMFFSRILGLGVTPEIYQFSMSYVYLMWYKLLPVIFCIGAAVVLYKILVYIKIDNKTSRYSILLFMGFPFVVYSQFIFGQYDSINMFFMLLAFYYYIKGNKSKFIIFSSISICFKMFSLFVFIPLLLLSEKKLSKIIKYCILAAIPTMICILMFVWTSGFHLVSEFSREHIKNLFSVNFDLIWLDRLPLFPILFGGVCFYSYITNAGEGNDLYRKSIFISICGYAAFFLTSLWHPFWIIMLTPYFILSFAVSKNKNLMLLLFAIIGVTMIFIAVCGWPSNADEFMLTLGGFSHIFDLSFVTGGFLTNQIQKIIPSSMIIGVFAAALIFICWLSWPKKDGQGLEKFNASFNKTEIFNSYVVLVLMTPLVYVVPVIGYLFYHLLF